jgi:hypothetical protein
MNNKLRELKEDYQSITPPHGVGQTWDILAANLPAQELPNNHIPRPSHFKHYYLYAVVLFVFLSASTFGIVQAAQISRPGDTLYSVKVLSDKVVSRVLGKPELKVEKRAEDVINESATSSGQLKKAAEGNNNTIDDTKKNIETHNGKQTDNLEDTLESQTEKFKKPLPSNAAAKGVIDSVINHTEETNNEVKGASTSVQEHQNQGEDHSNNGNGDEHRNPTATENAHNHDK